MAQLIRVSFALNPAIQQVSSYKVMESKNGAAYTLKGLTAVSPYDINAPLPGVYSYKIIASNLAGDSSESDVASSPEIPTKPATPIVEVINT